MSSKLNVETFVNVLKKSGLIEPDRLQKLVNDFTARGGKQDDSQKLADFLISNGVVTRWQCEQLLKGKHRGYFLGKYRLLSLLGKGGMSSVYLAEHVLMRRRCALKVLPAKRVDDSSYLARFHREAQAVASLDHPNIVRAYDVDHEEDREKQIHFLVMEYVEGSSLQELVQKQGVCGFCDTAEYIRQAALGLHHAHEAGMVHRDVKPGNLLVDPNGTVKVLDLGLARFFTGDEGEDALTIRHDEKVLGTADYLAPEQALDSHTVDARADIYSLGCTMYFLLTGRPPFTEGTLAQRLMAHQTKTPPTVESLRKDIPPSLAAIVRKMMSKKPEERYRTAKEAADVLYTWLDTNADAEWRRNHSGIFGSRESGANIPVAKPIVAMPVTPVTNAGTQLVGDTTVAPLQFAPPPPSKPAAVDQELSNFFAALSDSQKMAPPPAPAASKPAPPAPKPPKQVPPNSISASAPPHLVVPGSSLKLPVVTPAAPPAETEFPDFSATSDNTQPVISSKPASAKRRAPAAPSGVKKGTSKLPLDLKLPKLPMPVLAGIGGGIVLVLLLIVAYAMGLFSGSTTTSGGGPGRQPAPDVGPNLPPFPAEKREVSVGSAGEYKTINDALKAVRRRFSPAGDTDQMVVKIAAGTYEENIDIDGTIRRTNRRDKKADKPQDPDWPQGIKLVADGEVILQPTGDGAVIRLKNISKFVIEGIAVNATGKAVAVELIGDLPDSKLSGLKVSGFTQVGIAGQGAKGISFGTSQFILEKLTLTPAASSTATTGIQLRSGEQGESPSDTIVRNCRLIGPMAAGITISGTGPYRMTFVENIITKAQDGIRLEGAAQWKDIAITNNTFYEGRLGIVFTNMPGEGSMGLSFRRNLFAKMIGAEGVVQAGYDAGRLGAMLTTDRPGWELNYSDRPKPSTPQTGEIDPLCDNNGKRGEKGITFKSVDPADPKFLAPADNAVQRDVPGAKDGEKNWVGAVGP